MKFTEVAIGSGLWETVGHDHQEETKGSDRSKEKTTEVLRRAALIGEKRRDAMDARKLRDRASKERISAKVTLLRWTPSQRPDSSWLVPCGNSGCSVLKLCSDVPDDRWRPPWSSRL